jgi:hypothetical protein
LDYTKPVSAGAQAKISVGSFLPFSTASTINGNSLTHSVTATIGTRSVGVNVNPREVGLP